MIIIDEEEEDKKKFIKKKRYVIPKLPSSRLVHETIPITKINVETMSTGT